MVTGSLLILAASVGILRFPDVLMRMHATTKAGTLGLGLVAVSAMFAFGDLEIMGRAALVILFVLLMAPISAHMISRAAYVADVKLWEGTFVDELREYRVDRTSEKEEHR